MQTLKPANCVQNYPMYGSVWTNPERGIVANGDAARATIAPNLAQFQTKPLVYKGFPAASSATGAATFVLRARQDCGIGAGVTDMYATILLDIPGFALLEILPHESQALPPDGSWVDVTFAVPYPVSDWSLCSVSVVGRSGLLASSDILCDSAEVRIP